MNLWTKQSISEAIFVNSVMTKVSGNQSSDVSAYIIYYKDHIISTCPIIPALTPAMYIAS